VTLLHADPELSLPLARTDDEAEAVRAWRAFVRFTGAPALVEREIGVYEQARLGERSEDCHQRRRGRGVGARRPRFLARRKLGRPGSMTLVAREREFFGGRDEGLGDQGS